MKTCKKEYSGVCKDYNYCVNCKDYEEMEVPDVPNGNGLELRVNSITTRRVR
ncbi:MAG TPA: hypothetical protein VMC80_03080 [Patescibacteria group bacterium]|nr:hypothetical protein [Patescibacteria group bacterium]